MRSNTPRPNPYRSYALPLPAIASYTAPNVKSSTELSCTDHFGNSGIILKVHLEGGKDRNGVEWGTLEGTAVMIGPGIALTAKHVLEDHLDRLDRCEAYVVLQGTLEDGPIFWTVKRYCAIEGTDLLLLTLEFTSEPPSDDRLGHWAIRCRPPVVGSQVTIAGFVAAGHEGDGTFHVVNGTMNYQYDFLVACGEVLADPVSSWTRGHIAQVMCDNVGGMSGGPAFDEQGYLVGIVSSGLRQGPATISLLSPALGVELLASGCPFMDAGRKRFVDLPVDIVDPENLDLTTSWRCIDYQGCFPSVLPSSGGADAKIVMVTFSP